MAISGTFSPQRRPIDKAIILADGENLVFRFQDMLRSGSKKTEATIHIADIFVWHPNINMPILHQAIRANYYTSIVGDEPKLADIESQISKVLLNREVGGPTQICPHIYKKPNSNKSRIVDINITIDALRHSYHHHVDTIFLLSGDGDFLSLIQEVMRQGTQVWVGAFSSGLNKRIPTSVDRFFNLDEWFFCK
jgi:uncharacterized LabA/DUF88 family protein